MIPIGIAAMREILHHAPGTGHQLDEFLARGGRRAGLPAAAAAQYGSWQWMFWGSAAMGLGVMVLMAAG